MFEFKIRQIILAFDFSFFAIVTLMLLFCDNKYVVLCLLACIWHEIGHLIVMLLNKVKVDKVCFYGGGIKILSDKSYTFTQSVVKFKVLVAGSALNFITFFILKNCRNEDMCFFSAVNAVIGAFNMLPLQFLDGGKIFIMLIRNLCSYSNAIILERYLKWLNIILIMSVVVIVTIIGKGNPTLLITLCCLLFSAIKDDC